MRVLGHIHSFNDQEVIELSLGALLAQRRPLDGVLLVDNASTDGTLNRPIPPEVTVLRHESNLGTSGAVISGMRYALEHGFDWIWIFDADSAPRPDALEALLDFWHGLPANGQASIQNLVSLASDASRGRPYHGIDFTPNGFEPVGPPEPPAPYRCDAIIWSGSLYRTTSISAIGLPSADYVLDWGEFEYGYRGKQKGYRTYVVPKSRFDHNLGQKASYHERVSIGPLSFHVDLIPPIRLYYLIRNEIFFWLHEYPRKSLRSYLHALRIWSWMPRHLAKLALRGSWTEIRAGLRGIRDGLFKRMSERY